MKKVITAIGNNMLNESLRDLGKYEVIGNDIPYKEGVLEILSEIKNVDTLIISEILYGEKDFKETIKDVLKINKDLDIIVFLEKENKDLINFLFEKGIYKIFQNNQINISDLEKVLENENSKSKEELNEEIKRLKQIIEIQKLKGKDLEAKVTAITGSYGSGKSILTCILCKEFKKLQKRTLIIDFDTYNKSISVLYNRFIKETNYVEIKENIISVSKYEDLLLIEDEFLEDDEIFEIINELKKEYDQILIDTSGNSKSKYYGRILEISDDIIFVVVPTICDLKKALSLYEVIREDFLVPVQKIKLVINKENNYSVDNLIIQKMFGVNKINGQMKYSEEIENNINGKIKKKLKMKM